MTSQPIEMKSDHTSHAALTHIQKMLLTVAVFVIPLVMCPGLTTCNYVKCIASLLLISCLLVLWGLDAWRHKAWIIRVPWLLVPAAGLVLAGALSMVQAANARVAIQTLVLLTFFILLFWMIANMIHSERDIQWILGALLASATLAAVYGALQYWGVVPGAAGATDRAAIVSCMGNRNYLGAILLYLFYPSVIVLIGFKRLWAKVVTLMAISTMFAVMLLVEQTATRIVFILVSIALVIGAFIFRSVKPLRSNRWWLVSLACVVVFFSVFTMIRTPMQTPGDLWENNSGDARSWFWLIGTEMLADHPTVGVGLGHYKIDFFPYKAEFATTERGQAFDFSLHRVSQAHNDYIQAGAELGGIGILAILGLLTILAVSLWIRLRHNHDTPRLELLLLTVGILAFLAHGAVSFPSHLASSSLMFVVFCGLALSARFGRRASFFWTLTGWKSRAVHVLLTVIALTASTFAIRDLRANWLMERGFDQLQSGLYASAEIQLQQSLSLDFAPRQTYYYLAIAQIQLGKLSQAEENLEDCMMTFIDERVFLTYADLKLKLDKLEEAQAAVHTLLATHPSEEVEQRIRYIDASICIKQQRYDDAFQVLSSLVLDYPKFVPGLVALGQLCAAQGLSGSATNYLESALTLIEENLADARHRYEEGSTAMSKLVHDEIDTLYRQREHVINQLDAIR